MGLYNQGIYENLTGNPAQKAGGMSLMRPQGAKGWGPPQAKSDVSWMHQGNRGQMQNAMSQQWGGGYVGGGGVPYGPIWGENQIQQKVGQLTNANDQGVAQQQLLANRAHQTNQGDAGQLQASLAGMEANRRAANMDTDINTRWNAAEGNANHMLQGAMANATDLTNRARINADRQNQMMMMRWGVRG